MDDDDIFNSITGGSTQPAVQVPVSSPTKAQQDDPFGLLSFGNTQPQTLPTQPQSTGFDMGLLGFGVPSQQPVVSQQSVKPPQNTGGFNLLGEDFLGMGSSQPTQPVNNVPVQNTSFSFNQPPPQQQSFGWGVQPQQQAPQTQPQPNKNKFLAYENPQIQIWMNCIK